MSTDTPTASPITKLKPLQRRWLSDIGKTETGKLAFHLNHTADRNALQALLDGGLIKIETAFEGGLFLTAITDAGRAALASSQRQPHD